MAAYHSNCMKSSQSAKSKDLKRKHQVTQSLKISDPGLCKVKKTADTINGDGHKGEKMNSKLNPEPVLHCESETTSTCQPRSLEWRIIKGDNLKLRYGLLYSKQEARDLLQRCENELEYNTGNLAKVKMFGKLIDIPRKQVAHGDAGLSYTFSGNTVPAVPWTPLLAEIRDQVSRATGYEFNFVLINRYKDGHDYMGEHKDDEKDLCQGHPIASLSLGQHRDFVFKHQDSRGGHKRQRGQGRGAVRPPDPVTILLEHGSLLLMEHPTNTFWYHSLPRRTRALGVRLNMTFRKMNPAFCKPVSS